MNLDIALWLTQDAVTNGAVYALLALALVLVYTVTRVILVPQGEFISFAALSLATLQAGKLPGTACRCSWSAPRSSPPRVPTICGCRCWSRWRS
jgi:branched-subunit amino acid ABC-type transport system permease component